MNLIPCRFLWNSVIGLYIWRYSKRCALYLTPSHDGQLLWFWGWYSLYTVLWFFLWKLRIFVFWLVSSLKYWSPRNLLQIRITQMPFLIDFGFLNLLTLNLAIIIQNHFELIMLWAIVRFGLDIRVEEYSISGILFNDWIIYGFQSRIFSNHICERFMLSSWLKH